MTKKIVLSLVASVLTLPAMLLAQDSTSTVDAAAQAQAGEDKRLIKVAELASVEANQEFQRNVQIMQMARQQALKLGEAAERELDPEKKAELQTQFEDAVKLINENNTKMIENYGFSLNRNYTMVVEKSHVYMEISKEEAEKIKAAQEAEDAAQ